MAKINAYQVSVNITVPVLVMIYAEDEQEAANKAEEQLSQVDYSNKITIADLPNNARVVNHYHQEVSDDCVEKLDCVGDE